MRQVYAEATVVFPMIVAATFAKPNASTNGNGRAAREQNVERSRERYKNCLDNLRTIAGHGNGDGSSCDYKEGI